MKRIVLVLSLLLLMVGVSYAQWDDSPPVGEKEGQMMVGKCPETQTVGMVKDCLLCHDRITFQVNPTTSSQILTDETGKKYGYHIVTDIDDEEVKKFFDYLIANNIERAVLESKGPGGSLFDAWRIVGIVNYARSRGVEVDTVVYGYALSANLTVFMVGKERTVSPHAELMYHEAKIADYKEFTSSTSQDQTDILRHIQRSANKYIADKSKLTVKDLKDKISNNREFWMNGREALELGIATRLME